MKAKEELNEMKEEVEAVSKKLHELTEEELAQVSGGFSFKDIANAVRKTEAIVLDRLGE